MPVQPGYPAPGEMIGPYRIERTLGGGGMGVVFAALDIGLNRAVAIKVIAPHLADDHEFRTRFTREAQALAALDSAHVVHVYAYGEVDGRLYIATQLIPDGDLAARLQKYGAPPLPIALDLVRAGGERTRGRARRGPDPSRHQTGERAAADTATTHTRPT